MGRGYNSIPNNKQILIRVCGGGMCVWVYSFFSTFYINSSMLNNYIAKLKNSSLVLFENRYYLILCNLKLNVLELKNFFCTISEFATRVKNEDLLERKLREYGKIIFSKDAIVTCLKYFD